MVPGNEDDIDWEAHENMCIHMKGSNGGARKAFRDRALGGRAQQSARLSCVASGVLDELAQRGAARPIDCTKNTAAYCIFTQGRRIGAIGCATRRSRFSHHCWWSDESQPRWLFHAVSETAAA
jgi:hypothetical protein